MPVDVSLVLTAQQAANRSKVISLAIKRSGVKPDMLSEALITRKSIDARRGKISVCLTVRVYIKGESPTDDRPAFRYSNVSDCPQVVIVGAGPAGLFAALRLIELGLRPIVLERGKDVSARKRDVASLNRNGAIDPDSNFAFGEGGAGTFSDGKLYTRSRKRGDISRILHNLHRHGAPEEILHDAHPHIGTNVLPRVITSIRKTIEDCGGSIHFSSRVTSLRVSFGKVVGVELACGTLIPGVGVILAAGHSARDIYQMLNLQGIELEAKGFAIGVRVEHPQALIDTIQYHGQQRGDFLPAAAYSLVTQINGRGVYSFCMCPGGYMVPAASHAQEVVVNGMSPSARNSPYANSGIVVEVHPTDLQPFAAFGPLAGLAFQQSIEREAFLMVGRGVAAPAQRLADFVAGKPSESLPKTSYHPGTESSNLPAWLPTGVSSRLQQGFKQFDLKMRGFLTNEAVVLGVESRTSSPIRIPRSPDTLQHPRIMGLFPCGEGSGYAGGIVSSAVDGERCAEALARYVSIG